MVEGKKLYFKRLVLVWHYCFEHILGFGIRCLLTRNYPPHWEYLPIMVDDKGEMVIDLNGKKIAN